MADTNKIYDDAKIELIKSNANMYLTFNVISNTETGFLYCTLEDIAEMTDPQAEGSSIAKYRKEKDILPEEERLKLYDRCSMIPALAYTMFDYIRGAFSALEEKRDELFALTGLDVCLPEITDDLNGMVGLTRDGFWTRVKDLSEEFPLRGDLPVDYAMKAGEEYALKIFKRLNQDLASKEIIPNDVLISNIKSLLG